MGVKQRSRIPIFVCAYDAATEMGCVTTSGRMVSEWKPVSLGRGQSWHLGLKFHVFQRTCGGSTCGRWAGRAEAFSSSSPASACSGEWGLSSGGAGWEHLAPEERADRLRKVCPLPTRWARRRDMLRLPGFLQGKCSLPRTVSLLSKDRGTVSEKKSMGSMPTSVPLEGTLDVSGATEGEGTEGGEDTEGGDEED